MYYSWEIDPSNKQSIVLRDDLLKAYKAILWLSGEIKAAYWSSTL